MRQPLPFILLTLVLLLPAAAIAAPTVTIQLKPLKPRTVRTTSETLVMDMSLDMSVDGQHAGSFQAKRTETTRTEELVELDKPEHRRVQVEYVESRQVEWSKSPDGEGTNEDIEQVEGKVYLVDWTPKTGVQVEYVDGSAPPLLEATAVAEDFEDLDEAHSRIAKLLAGRKLVVGEKVEVSVDGVAELLGTDEEFVIDEFGITLDRKQRIGGKPCAVFVADVVLSRREPGMELIVEVAGEFVIRINDGQTLSYSFHGPMTSSGDASEPGGPKMMLTGGGTLDAKATASYSK